MRTPEDNYFFELVNTARSYCRLIDHLPGSLDNGLPLLVKLLPRLHAAIVALHPRVTQELPVTESADFEHRFELFSWLRIRLGSRDSYWMEFDDIGPDRESREQMSGSLADDLTDIYFELKQGLQMLDSRSPEQIAGWWQNGFRLHWGQHLVDAERHLYSLRACGRLQ